MAFKSAKRRSGQATGNSGQSNTSRVARAGMGAKATRTRGNRTPFLGQLVVSAILTTSATITTGIVSRSDGTIYWIVDTNPLKPTVGQIKAGLEQGGGAATDAANGVAAAPFVASAAGLTLVTEYFYWQVQESLGGGSAITGTSFTTAAV